jgi:hypothetical protein
LILLGCSQTGLAIHSRIHLEPLVGETFLEEGKNLQIIIDQ